MDNSYTIATYIVGVSGDNGLAGKTDIEKAQVDQWMTFLREETAPLVKCLQYWSFGHIACNS